MGEERIRGKAGSIYIESSDDGECDVWFEDFCIIGQGKSRVEALQDAARHLVDIGELVKTALGATPAPQAVSESGG